jgi:hypothetical protein
MEATAAVPAEMARKEDARDEVVMNEAQHHFGYRRAVNG